MASTEVCPGCGHAKVEHIDWYGGGEECLACLRGEPRIMSLRERIAAMAACHPAHELWRWNECRSKDERAKWLHLADRIIAEMEAA